jgi:hypothetical protein
MSKKVTKKTAATPAPLSQAERSAARIRGWLTPGKGWDLRAALHLWLDASATRGLQAAIAKLGKPRTVAATNAMFAEQIELARQRKVAA